MRKNKGATECDKSTVTCDVGTVQREDGTIKCEKKKIKEPPNVIKVQWGQYHQMWEKTKGTTECDKSIVDTQFCTYNLIKEDG